METLNTYNKFIKGITYTLIFLSLLPVVNTIAEEDDDEIKWDLYGSARITPEYWHRKKWYLKKPVLDGNGVDSIDPITFEPLYDGVLEDTVPTNRFLMDLNYGSRFGVKGKSDRVGFQFELGWVPVVKEIDVLIQGTDANVDKKYRDGLRLRRLFGEWYINEMFSFLVGHEWTITNFFVSTQGFYHEMSLSHSGALITGRRPQVKLTAGNGFQEDALLDWKAELALVKPDTFIIDLSQTVAPAGEENRPKIEIGGSIGKRISELVNLNLQTVLGTHSYDLVIFEEQGNKGERETVESWVAGMNFKIDIWRFSLSATYTKSQNIGSYGVWIGSPEASRGEGSGIDLFYPVVNILETYNPVSGQWDVDTNALGEQLTGIFNAKTDMYTFVASLKILDWLGLEVGGGWVNADHDLHTVTELKGSTLNALKRNSFYINAPVNLYNGKLLFSPEFSFSDFGGFPGAGKWYSTGMKMQIGL